MLFLGFIVLLLIIGKIHADNERAEQERQEQREYTTRKWQQAADEDELFRLEMGAKGCAYLIQSGFPACSRPTFDGWNSCAPNSISAGSLVWAGKVWTLAHADDFSDGWEAGWKSGWQIKTHNQGREIAIIKRKISIERIRLKGFLPPSPRSIC